MATNDQFDGRYGNGVDMLSFIEAYSRQNDWLSKASNQQVNHPELRISRLRNIIEVRPMKCTGILQSNLYQKFLLKLMNEYPFWYRITDLRRCSESCQSYLQEMVTHLNIEFELGLKTEIIILPKRHSVAFNLRVALRNSAAIDKVHVYHTLEPSNLTFIESEDIHTDQLSPLLLASSSNQKWRPK